MRFSLIKLASLIAKECYLLIITLLSTPVKLASLVTVSSYVPVRDLLTPGIKLASLFSKDCMRSTCSPPVRVSSVSCYLPVTQSAPETGLVEVVVTLTGALVKSCPRAVVKS